MIQKDTPKDACKRRWYENPKTLVIGTRPPAQPVSSICPSPRGAVHLPPPPPRKRTNTKCERGGGGQEEWAYRSSPSIAIPNTPSAPGAQNQTRERRKQSLETVSWVPTVYGSTRLHQSCGYVCIQGSGGPIFGFLITPLLKLNCLFIKRILS